MEHRRRCNNAADPSAFLFIGAEPNTDWIANSGIALDKSGFVLTGPDAGVGRHQLEASRAGIYAIGDVRSGSIKRVAAAVGEGAQVVAAIHARNNLLATRSATAGAGDTVAGIDGESP